MEEDKICEIEAKAEEQKQAAEKNDNDDPDEDEQPGPQPVETQPKLDETSLPVSRKDSEQRILINEGANHQMADAAKQHLSSSPE